MIENLLVFSFLSIVAISLAAYFLPEGRLTLRETMLKAGIAGAALLLVVLLTSCAPDPRQAAQAQAVEMQAQQQAADAQAARAQREAEAAIKLAEAQAASEQWVESWNFFVKVWWFAFTFSASASTCVVLLALTIGLSWGMIGSGRAASQAAWVRANLIGLDKETRQFPLYLFHLGNGKFTLTDMNSGMTQTLDIRIAADRQMIAAAGAARLAGTVAYEARMAKHSDSSGVAMVGMRPTVVGAKVDGLEVGEILMEAENAD